MRLSRVWLAMLALCLTVALPAWAAITGIVMSTDGQPVAGARVSLLAFETPDGRRARLLSASPEQVPIAAAQTDGNGRFSLASPKEPTAALAIYAKGFEPTQRPVERDDELGAIALVKSEQRSGSVTAAGKPVAGATVVISYNGYEYTTKADDNGRYEAPDPKRARSILVLHDGFAISEETLIGGAAATSMLQRTLVAPKPVAGRVVAGDGTSPVAKATISVDGWPLATSGEDGSFTIPRAAPRWTTLTARKDSLLGQRSFSTDALHTIRLEKSATIIGRVIDVKSKQPIPGAIVRALIPRTPGDPLSTAMTDVKGAFTLSVSAGNYAVMALHPAYELNQADAAASLGQQVSRDVALTPLVRVSGVVVDEASKPVVAARISTEDLGSPMGMRFVRMLNSEAVSGPDGRYTIRFGGDSDLRLKAAKKGLPVAKSETLRLAPGERKSGLILTIPTGVAVTGRVTDAEGNALANVAVVASEAERDRGGIQRMMFTGLPATEEDAVRTGRDGAFSMQLKEGTYDFTFRREGYAMQNVRGQSVSANANNVVEATLNPAVEIRGRVVRSGVGVEGVSVFAIAGMDSRAVTGPDGSFLLSGLPAGATRVNFTKATDFVQEMRSITAPASDVVIELPAGGRVTGRVVDKSSRKPIAQFQAGLSRSRSSGGMVMMTPPQLRSFSSEDGTFTLENVPAGTQDIVASAAGYSNGRANVTIEEGKTLSDVEIELDMGTRLVGKVTGSDGAPLSDVNVVLSTGSMGVRLPGENRTVTDANGEYVLDGLSSGEQTFDFSHPKHVSARKQVTLKGREVRLDAQLGGGQRVSGIVVTESGAPVADAEVTAGASGAAWRTARTNASGTFELESLTPARYRFTASKAGFADGTLEDVDIAGGAPIRITLRTGGTIYGRVIGLTRDELSTASVEANNGRNSMEGAVDSSGNYKLEGVPPGTVNIMASVFSRSLTGRKTSSRQTVVLEAGSSRQVDLEFPTATIISGRVTRNGQPLKGANITFIPRGRSSAMSSVATDEEGKYSVTGLEEGEYNVAVLDIQRFSPYQTKYDVRGSATFDIDYRTNALRGRVVDAMTNAPIADVSVQLRMSTPAESLPGAVLGARTDSAGTFLIDHVQPGTYVANAAKEGYGNQAMDLMITDRAADDLEMKLTRNDGVLLKVVDARDQRPLTASAVVYDAQNRIVHETRTFFSTADGDTRLPLAPGRYTAWVSSMGYAPRSVSFQSPSNQTVALAPGGTLVIRSKHSSRARARLLDANGAIHARYSNRPSSMELNPSPGTTVLDNIAPGTYTLQLLGDNDAVVDSVRVTIIEGQTATAEI